MIKARRTRAHALQLHGFLELAGLELDAARHAISTAHAEEEYLEAELVDLLLRRTSVDVADSPHDYRQSRDRILEAFDHNPNPVSCRVCCGIRCSWPATTTLSTVDVAPSVARDRPTMRQRWANS